MSVYLILGGIVLWFYLLGVAKQMYQQAEERWRDRVMANYLEAEAARAHRIRLEAIDACRRATVDDLIRTSQEASGEVIEGTAIEVRR
jgi:hypothetical protein